MINLNVILAFSMIAQIHGSHNGGTEAHRSNFLKTAVKLTTPNTLGAEIMYTINSPTIITYLKLHYEKRNKTCYLGVINHMLHHYRLSE